jgi:hypothetical protein
MHCALLVLLLLLLLVLTAPGPGWLACFPSLYSVQPLTQVVTVWGVHRLSCTWGCFLFSVHNHSGGCFDCADVAPVAARDSYLAGLCLCALC